MINEVAPPGFGHTKGDKKKGVKKGGTAAAFDRARKEGRFKGSKSDMFAIMWAQKKKGAKPHYKPGTDKKYKKYQEEEKQITPMQDNNLFGNAYAGTQPPKKKKKLKEALSAKDTKKLNKASVLSYSDDPKDQHRARVRQAEIDFKDLMRQRAKKKKAVSEEKSKGEVVQELFGLGNKKYPYGKATKKNPRGKRDQAELDRAQAYLKKHPNFGKKKQDANESFEIDKSAHKTAQKKAKMRNLAKGNTNPNEKAAAEKKAGGPKLIGERLGGKGYKPYTSLTGKKVSGDWEDSDRGAGNKAKKRAGGKVEKKSPTYQAYVLNKEEVKESYSDWKKKAASAMKRVAGKKEERKAQKATDAGARAKRLLQRKVHAKYVSGSEDLVPDEIRD